MQNTLLVVEDDFDVRENITEILTENSYNVISASNGKEAIGKIILESPDLILSDIMMPEMNGFQFLEFVQNSRNFAHIPFVFLTAKSSTQEIRDGMMKGADDYLPKPFKAYELLEMVEIKLKKKEFIKEQLNKIKENIALAVPHELRTPLTPIIGYSGMMLDDAKFLSVNEIEEMSSIIITSALRLNRSIEKFIQFASIQYELNEISGDKSLKFNTSESIEYLILKIVKEEQNYTNGRTKLELEIEDSRLKIDEFYFNICIKELVENAFKFSGPDSVVKIKGENKNNNYELFFENTGGGFAADQIKKISVFNKQYDLTMPGSGLGLPIVKKIIEYFGGNLEIVNEPHGTTRVTIRVPARKILIYDKEHEV
ncbi:MAG: response regulator [Ignavibacteriaceae bacterium]